jgi:hypothetical protein
MLGTQCVLLIKILDRSFEPLNVRLGYNPLRNLEILCRKDSRAFLNANNCKTVFGKLSIKSPFKKSSDSSLHLVGLKKEQQIFTTKRCTLAHGF